MRRKKKKNYTKEQKAWGTRKKLVWVLGIVLLLLIGLGVRITYINATNGEQYKKEVLSRSQQTYDSKVLPFKRGSILDRNNTVLAQSDKVYNIILDCNQINQANLADKQPIVDALVACYGFSAEEIMNLITGDDTKNSPYQVIRRDISIKERQVFEDYIDVSEEGKAEKGLDDDEAKRRATITGVWFEDDYIRSYPFNSLACDALGFTYDGTTADWGLEGYYSSILNGSDGRQYGYFNDDSEVEQEIIEPQNGYSIVSTLDLYIQQSIETRVKEFMANMANGPLGEDAAKNIGVIVENPQNGEILGMYSSGEYDLNDPRNLETMSGISQEILSEEVSDSDKLAEIWQNYCISASYEPGSTIKPVTVATGLETGALRGDETFYCDGFQVVSGQTIQCSNTLGDGEETILDAIRNSCNDALMQIGDLIGASDLLKYEKIFNFGSRTGIDLPGEATGILYNEEDMRDLEVATASFGQGFNCTMIQEISAISSIANGGYYYEPHMVSKIIDENGTIIKNIEPTLLKQTVSEQTANTVKTYMKASVENGTSEYARIAGYSSGGKTGTAEKLPRSDKKYLVSFIGFWPYENPEVVIYVVVDEPNAAVQGDSVYAQYISRLIMQDILPYLNIFPDQDTQEDIFATLERSRLRDFMLAEYTSPSVEDTASTEDAASSSGDAAQNENLPEPAAQEEQVTLNNQETEGITNEEAELILQ